MITLDVWLLILGFSIPMVISPGPGNTLLATAGGRFGMKGTLFFLVGFEVANLFWCFVYGLGLSQILTTHPIMHDVLKWGGIAYTLYLAYGFFRSSSLSEQRELKPLGILDGFMSVSLNPKIHSMILVLFAQFLSPSEPLVWQVTQIAIAFMLICVVCHLPWVYSGQVLFSRIKTQKSLRLQGWIFGSCMILVAVFTAFA